MLEHSNSTSSRLIFARATFYKTKIRVFIPNVPFLANFNVSVHGSGYGLSDNVVDNIERSLRRSKKRISDYILTNSFELFVTFTFAVNRQDVDEKRRQMSNWLRNQRKRNGKFDYLIVPEFHKDGKSLHFHALFNGYCGDIRRAINPETGLALEQKGQPVYVLAEYTLGFNNAKRILPDVDSQNRIALYVQKYITKDMPLFHNKQRYWASKGLKLPKIQDNPEKWYEKYAPDWEIENDFGKVLEFQVGKNPAVDRFWEKYR